MVLLVLRFGLKCFVGGFYFVRVLFEVVGGFYFGVVVVVFAVVLFGVVVFVVRAN